MTNIDRRSLLRGLGIVAGTSLVTRSRRILAATPDVVNIAYFVETKPTMIAKGEGWFSAAAKTRINWVEVGSGAEINTAIAAGSIDLGIGIGSSPTAAGLSQGIPYKLVGMLDNIGPAEELTVRKSANIRSVADLKGKKVGTPFGSTSHFRLLGLLKLNNLTQADVTVLDLRPDALVAAWSRRDIDAAYVWSPAKSKLIAGGGEVFRTYQQLDAAGYGIADLIVARTAFVERSPDVVTGLLRAYARALDTYKADPTAAAAIVARQAGVTSDVAIADLAEYEFVPLQTQLSPEWLGAPGKGGKFDQVLKRTADFLVEQKSIRSAPGLAAFEKGTDTTALARAVA
jgi:taurine transport system substrate-binding protein